MASEKISSPPRLLIGAAIFSLALVMRLTNAPLVFAGGVPRLSPLDELYHWKRITFSASHFPAVREFDPDRGEGGAYCPWPPPYDPFCAAIALILGGKTAAAAVCPVASMPRALAAISAALSR